MISILSSLALLLKFQVTVTLMANAGNREISENVKLIGLILCGHECVFHYAEQSILGHFCVLNAFTVNIGANSDQFQNSCGRDRYLR